MLHLVFKLSGFRFVKVYIKRSETSNIKKTIMKKYVMLAIASVFIVNVATMAQEQTPPQGTGGEKKELKQDVRHQVSPQKRAETIALKLGLTEVQKTKVQELFEKQDVVRNKHLADTKKLWEEHLVKFENERKAQDAELEKIIGKANFQKLENERIERKAKMAERIDGNQNHQFSKRVQRKEYNRLEEPLVSAQLRAEKMSKVLGLTDEEKSKVQALFEKQGTKREQRQAEQRKIRDEQMAKTETDRKLMNADLEKIIGTEKYQLLENKRGEFKANIKDRKEGNKGRDWQNNNKNQTGMLQNSPEKRAERMAKVLALNESQKNEVQALLVKQDGIRQQQIEKVEKMKEALKFQFAAQRKTNDEALSKIIGEEKFRKFESLRDQRQEKIKEKSDVHKNHPQKDNIENN
jgi:hypothetical protein